MPSYADYYSGRGQRRGSLVSPYHQALERMHRIRMGSMLSTVNPFSGQTQPVNNMGQRMGYGSPGAAGGGQSSVPAGVSGVAMPLGGQRLQYGPPQNGLPWGAFQSYLGQPQQQPYRPLAMSGKRPPMGREFGDVIPRRRPTMIPLY